MILRRRGRLGLGGLVLGATAALLGCKDNRVETLEQTPIIDNKDSLVIVDPSIVEEESEPIIIQEKEEEESTPAEEVPIQVPIQNISVDNTYDIIISNTPFSEPIVESNYTDPVVEAPIEVYNETPNNITLSTILDPVEVIPEPIVELNDTDPIPQAPESGCGGGPAPIEIPDEPIEPVVEPDIQTSIIEDLSLDSEQNYNIKTNNENSRNVHVNIHIQRDRDRNRPPVLEPIEDIVAEVGDSIKVIPVATDPDGDELTFSYSSPLDSNGELQTDSENVENYHVIVGVSDGELKDFQEFDITVEDGFTIDDIVDNTPNNKIAFMSDRDGNSEIYFMDEDGSNVRKVIENPSSNYSPALSPNGNEIAFVSDRDGDPEIYVKNVLDDSIRKLTDNSIDDWSPSWSPDGTEIVYDSGTSSRAIDIYKMSAVDGSGKTNLTNTPTVLDRNASWSPLGDKIAFESCMDSVGGNPEIYTTDPNGLNVVRLTFHGAGDYSPKWSPDGTEITIHSFRNGQAEVYRMSAIDGSGLTRVTNNSAVDACPIYSPDGQRIIFYSNRDGDYDIYRMNLDGSNLEKLTDDTACNSSPSCSFGDNISNTSTF